MRISYLWGNWGVNAFDSVLLALIHGRRGGYVEVML